MLQFCCSWGELNGSRAERVTPAAADVCQLPGFVYPVWGADHYLRPAGVDIRGLAARILHYLCDTWDEQVPSGIGTRELS